MPLRGVPCWCKGEHVLLIVNRRGGHVLVDARHHLAVTLVGAPTQIGQDSRRRIRRLAGGEADPHVVTDAGFAGRVDLSRRELRYENTRFNPCAAAHADHVAGRQELLYAVQDVEVHDAHQFEAAPLRQPGQGRR